MSNQPLSLTSLDIIESLRKDVNVSKMLDTPFFQYLEQNKLSAEQFKAFFEQYYLIVKTSYRMLAAGILNAPSDNPELIKHLTRFLETELGGTPNHLVYYHRWAESFGVSQDMLQAVEFNEKSLEFKATLMSYFSVSDPLQMLAAQCGVEDCAEVLIEGFDRGFKKYPMTARDYGYLAIHRLLENDEDGHSRWAINALAASPNLHSHINEVTAIYRRIYDVFVGVFDGIYYGQWGQSE